MTTSSPRHLARLLRGTATRQCRAQQQSVHTCHCRQSITWSTAAPAAAPPPTSSLPPAPTDTEPTCIKKLPGPGTKVPILGNLFMYLRPKNQGRIHEALAEKHNIHGKMFREKLGFQLQLHISDPELIEFVLRNEGKYPIRPAFKAWIMYRRVTGKPLGIFTGEGEDWKRVRSTLNKKIMRPKPVLGYTSQLNTIAEDLVNKIRHVRDTHGDKHVSESLVNELYKWSMESVGYVVFQKRMGCLEPCIPRRSQEFINAIQQMMSSSIPMIVWEELHRFINSRFWRRHKGAWDTIFDIGKSNTDAHIANMDKRMEAGEAVEEKGELLSYMLSSRNMSKEEVYTNVTELFVAGVDTTSNSLCFILHLLATHPHAQQRLQKEVDDVLQGGAPTADNIHNMPYLKCVLREAQRLYPVVTMNCRVVEDDIVIAGYKIPKKTNIVMNHHAACRNEDIFENAGSFIPERWLRSEEGSSIHPFASLPFGFGSRSCIGTKIAKLELYLALSNISQQFNLEPLEGVTLKPSLRVLLTPGKKLPVRFIDR